MKKLWVLISVILISFSGFTRDVGVSWVEVSHSRLDCQKIHFGLNNARIVLTNGEKKTVPIALIKSYAVNGKVFVKLPVYKEGIQNGQMKFMELIKTEGELSLYQLEEPDYTSTLMDAKIYSLFLYNGDKLYLALDEKTLPNICHMFGINYHFQ
jgi:hypothetical protein